MGNINVVSVLTGAAVATGTATSATLIAQPAARSYGDELLHNHRAEIVLNIDVGAGTESLGVGLEVSDNGTAWYMHRFLDLQTALYESATQAVFTADTSNVRMLYEGAWRYVRMSATNSGQNVATINAAMALVAIEP